MAQGGEHAYTPNRQTKYRVRSRGYRLGSWLPVLFGGFSLGLITLCSVFFLVLFTISALVNLFLIWQLSGFEIAVRKPLPASPEVPVAEAMAAAVIPTPTSLPTPTLTPTPAAPTPTPHPMADYTIEGLRARAYPGGPIQVREVLTTTIDFTKYYIDYPSDGLTITGVVQVPPGEGPFPVIILNHGYISRSKFWSGADTWNAAAYLNRQGYLTIAPDFRGWGESDTGNSFFRTGPVIDTLNLISSLPSVPQADPERLGMWGHSMGGGVTTKAITVDPRIKAAVLYAPLSANDAQVLERWGPGCGLTERQALTSICSDAEVLVQDVENNLFMAYADAVYNPVLLQQTSPINYFDAVTAPIQIHTGLADTTTPPEWSVEIHEALQAAGKEVEYFGYPGQGHAFKGQSWQLFMERVTAFFDRHLLNTRGEND